MQFVKLVIDRVLPTQVKFSQRERLVYPYRGYDGRPGQPSVPRSNATLEASARSNHKESLSSHNAGERDSTSRIKGNTRRYGWVV